MGTYVWLHINCPTQPFGKQQRSSRRQTTVVTDMMDCLRPVFSSFTKKKTTAVVLEQPENPQKSINFVCGFFLLVNFIVGTGFLGIPYALYHAGLLAGILTLMVTVFSGWNSSAWVLEVMARAQVMNYVFFVS